jgi:peptidoglycan/xylan/chitin deacetylase (PgdA/CDA1 family)
MIWQANTIREVLRRALRLRRRGPAILLYHRVAAPACDPQCLCVSPENFDAHMCVLRGYADVMTLADMANCVRCGMLPPRGVAVTFDDGYADNFTTAAEILKSRRVPATMFVASGFVDAQITTWWDELERIFLRSGKLTATLDLRDVGLGVYGGLDAEIEASHLGWNVRHPDDPTPRHAAYRALCRKFKRMPSRRIVEALDLIRRRTGIEPVLSGEHGFVDSSALREAACDGRIEIGAHTVTHAMLSGLVPTQQLSEIVRSRVKLESIIQRDVKAFSYPFGGPLDYDRHSVNAVRMAGYDYACANMPGSLVGRRGVLELPRCIAPNVSGGDFLRWLEGIFGHTGRQSARPLQLTAGGPS